MGYSYEELLELKRKFKESPLYNSKKAYEKFKKSFAIKYAHDSTAIEGNTLTLAQVKTILEDKIPVRGKNLREIYEVVNHEKAFEYICKCVDKKEALTEKISKDIHYMLVSGVFVGGIYRAPDCRVRITGSRHKVPAGSEMFSQIKDFWDTLPQMYGDNVLKLAAYTHAEFVGIHPFEDGNGRTARLMMNYQLMLNDFLPITISKHDRLKYYQCLEEYHLHKNLEPLYEMIFLLEKCQYLECITGEPTFVVWGKLDYEDDANLQN